MGESQTLECTTLYREALFIVDSRRLELTLRRREQNPSTSSFKEEPSERLETSSNHLLRELKARAWLSQRGKGREKAMLQYVELVTSLAPQWRVANILAGHAFTKDAMPNKMTWVCEVKVERRKIGEVIEQMSANSLQLRRTSKALLAKGFRVTSIKVLQASNNSNARLFGDEEAVGGAPKGTKRKTSAPQSSELGNWLAGIRKLDLTLRDCIIDKKAHKTMQEQRKYFAKTMRKMARSGHDGVDGWKLYGRTNSPLLTDSTQVDIHRREVDWSSSHQLRTVVTTPLSVQQVFNFLIHDFADEKNTIIENAMAEGVSRKLQEAASQNWYPFIKTGPGWGTALQYRIFNMPWPLSSRDLFIVQDYVLRDQGKGGAKVWFHTYNHEIAHPYFAPRSESGFVRFGMKFQGLLGKPVRADEDDDHVRLCWLANMEFGGSLPSAFSLLLMSSLMALPIQIASDARAFTDPDPEPADNSPGGSDLSIQDCLVDKTQLPTIMDQRAHFEKLMLGMARHGHDDEEGWTFLSRTRMEGVSPEQQIDVHEREVEWSGSKQYRSVVETTFSCDDVFDAFLLSFGQSIMSKEFAATLSGDQKTALYEAKYVYPFIEVGDDSATALLLRTLPFPWPLTPRDIFIVQDYVRRKDSGGFFTYNHDIKHPQFPPRDGFVRAAMRNQGSVGLPIKSHAGGPKTRLTWLVNVEFGGLLPRQVSGKARNNPKSQEE